MHYTGPVYRPPYEADSLILQATIGCSHNACTFCSMYRDIEYCAAPLEEIEEDLAEVARYFPWERRVFLSAGDAFALPAERLAKIAQLIHAYLPMVETIGCYAQVKNVAAKTDEELRLLAKLGYAELNIGLESGLDDVLSFMGKGYDAAQARVQMERLHQAGIPFNINIITAAAGPNRALEHARANAQLVNDVRPTLVFVSPLHVDPGARLESIVQEGRFAESTVRQYVQEEIAFLEGLEVENCTFFGLHVSNPVRVAGELPRDKQRLLQQLEAGIARIPQAILDTTPAKGAEGRIKLS